MPDWQVNWLIGFGVFIFLLAIGFCYLWFIVGPRDKARSDLENKCPRCSQLGGLVVKRGEQIEHLGTEIEVTESASGVTTTCEVERAIFRWYKICQFCRYTDSSWEAPDDVRRKFLRMTD